MNPPDQENRDAIRNDLHVTMLVEAAAGTGKTTNLVKRLVNLVESGRATPSTIAAITFTLKAAAQLREQFHTALREDTTAAFIGTTHAFCARLLRERPVEAMLDPEFEELDEPAARAITSDFWNRWFDAKAVSEDPLIGEARAVGLDRKTLRAAFVRIIEYPDVRLVSERRPRPDLRPAVDALVSYLDVIAPLLPATDDPDSFLTMIRHLIQKRRSSDLVDVNDQFSLLDDARNYKLTLNRWPDKNRAKQLRDDYLNLVANIVRPTLQQWKEHVHGIALDVLRPAAAEFADERRRNGTLTFQDLLVCARDLLRDHPNVRRYFQRRFTHIFVDEFQDTDPLQAEVLMYLTGKDVEERDWRKLEPRPGSLFIVGDPKQSIYRFRRADITTYLQVRERIEKSGGRIVPLWTNFRSTPEICTYVNDAFSKLFTQADIDAGRQAKHVDLESFSLGAPASSPAGPPASSPSGPPAASPAVFGLETPNGSPNDMATAEAEVVAAWIRRNVASGTIRYSDVMLVSWFRPRLALYAAAFERLGIPYEITGSKAFKGLTDLEAAMPLLRAIVTPEDEVAIVAFLRGPLCGVDDDALYRYRQAGGRFSPFGDVAEGTDARIANGLQIIRESIEDARKHPPAAAIARLFDRIGLIGLSASGERPGTRAGNLLQAVSIARDLSARGATLEAIIEYLGDLLEEPPDTIEELDVDPTRTDAVRLMNLHQVKGLEAPVVFLIDPSDAHEWEIDLFVDRSGEESRGHFVVMNGKKKIALPVGWDGYEQTESEFKRAERIRLLYVAATRAMRMLVVGFHTSKGAAKGAWKDLASRMRERFDRGALAAETVGPPPPAAKPYADAMTDLSARFTVARTPSYSVLPVTKVAHASHLELVKAEEGLGKGTSWGRVLHRLFEAMLRDESLNVPLYAANLIKDEERDPVELSEVLRVVEAVRGSSLWLRVKAADERYVEIPFALTVPRRDVGIDEAGDTLLHGVIDLVFREGATWYVVDYKTDSTVGRLDALTEYYAPQVRMYAEFWGRVVGGRAVGGLFFVDGCVEGWVA